MRLLGTINYLDLESQAQKEYAKLNHDLDVISYQEWLGNLTTPNLAGCWNYYWRVFRPRYRLHYIRIIWRPEHKDWAVWLTDEGEGQIIDQDKESNDKRPPTHYI